MKPIRLALLAVATACAFWVAIGIHAREEPVPLPMKLLSSLHGEGSMPALDGAVDWLNSKPLTTADLRGKVVLVDFWTYSCINWQRTLPHLRAWAEKYRNQGLVVIGVHSPEFGFEKDIDNVRRASVQLKVDYPVAVDSEHGVWRAFANQYWPALYLIDAQGTIRYHRFGEGDYEASERAIQQLLIEAGAKGVDTGLVHVEGAGSQAQAHWADLRSPETYVGSARAERFTSRGGMAAGQKRLYAAPEAIRVNSWALSGEWTVQAEEARLDGASGRVTYRFHARDLHLVMGPAGRAKPVPFRVLVDGRPPGLAHGADIDAEGRGLLDEHRLYQLIRQPGPIADRVFEIEFLEPGASVYAFTFG